MRKKKEIQEPNYYLVYLIDKGGRRWYSPRIVEEYCSLEATKVKCKEALDESDQWVRAEIVRLEPVLAATVVGANDLNL